MNHLSISIPLTSPFPKGYRLEWFPVDGLLSCFSQEEGTERLYLCGSQEFTSDEKRVLQPVLLSYPFPCSEEVLLAYSANESLFEEINMWLLLQGCLARLHALGLDVAEQGAGGYVLLPH